MSLLTDIIRNPGWAQQEIAALRLVLFDALELARYVVAQPGADPALKKRAEAVFDKLQAYEAGGHRPARPPPPPRRRPRRRRAR